MSKDLDDTAAPSGDGAVSLTKPDDDATPDDVVDGDAPRKHRPVWQESLVLLALALVLAILVKAFFVQAFYIPSASMEPGLVENDRILVQKVSYWFGGTPSRGDVVVFEDPGGWLGNTDDNTSGLEDTLSKIGLYPTGGHLVKRVIGVAGDVVQCCDDQGRVLVNGKPLEEGGYIADLPEGYACNAPMVGCEWKTPPVPDGEIFVMGDNRANSADSTVHLCLPDEVDCARDPFVDVGLVVGKVFAIAWPAGHWGFVSRPDEFDDVPAAGD